MRTITENPKYQRIECGMSNFDHSIDKGLENKLKSGKVFSQYSGYNFCGYVYYDKKKKKFGCEVWQYHSLTEVIYKKKLEEIMEEVCEKYGSD